MLTPPLTREQCQAAIDAVARQDGRANGRWSYTGDVRRVPREAEAIRG